MQKTPSTPALIAQRLLGLAVSCLVLWLVLRRLDTGALKEVLQRCDPLWLVFAFVAYACATTFAALRWHKMLLTTKTEVDQATTFRFAFIGNFFNALLFGPAGGDIIKTSLYAQWFQRPLPDVIAASFLDRMLGLGGSILLGLTGLIFAFAADGGEQLHHITFHSPAFTTVVLCALVIGLIYWWWKRRRRESFLGQTATALTNAVRELRKNPLTAFAGLIYGFILQVCFCLVLAFCLRSISVDAIPWLKLAWTFPVIGIVATLPVTVAGAGVREGASVALFGLYGVKPAECVAAALLTLLIYVLWALIGAGVFLHARRQRQVKG